MMIKMIKSSLLRVDGPPFTISKWERMKVKKFPLETCTYEWFEEMKESNYIYLLFKLVKICLLPTTIKFHKTLFRLGKIEKKMDVN